MTLLNVTRKVYSAEELHRLRYTQSQPKLREAIEEHDGDDAEIVKANMSSPSSHDINRRWIEQLIATPDDDEFSHRTVNILLTTDDSPSEHVLRGSKSFAARSFRSRASANGLRITSGRSNNENLAGMEEPVRQPLGVPSYVGGPVLGAIVPNGQILRSGLFKFGPSPTPSIKKKKAEAIVKAHGSPTHVRVTAGGRIVPSEQSPLCHPRYGYSAIKTNGGLIKFAPNHHAGKPQWTRATEDGFVAQDMHGNLCQIVNGTILPLNEVDGALRLYMPAPNLQVTQRGASLSAAAANPAFAAPQIQTPVAPVSTRPVAPEPSIASQIAALELEYSKLEHELKDVDKTEVIHGRTMGRVAKDALIAKRRELVVSMDKIRKASKELKSRPPPNAPTSPRAMLNRQSTSPSHNRLPPFLQGQPVANFMQATTAHYSQCFAAQAPASQYGTQPTPSPDEVYVGQSWMIPPASMFVPPPPFDGSVAVPFSPVQPSVVPFTTMAPESNVGIEATLAQGIPQNDGARSSIERLIPSSNRSRAVSIRAPESKPAAGGKSCLNPMSPIYKPAIAPSKGAASGSDDAVRSIRDRVPTPLSPLPQLQPPVQSPQAVPATDEVISPLKKTAHLHSSSISSFDTADFFPRNTREYSTRQHAYPFQTDPTEHKENASPEQVQHSPLTPEQGRFTDTFATQSIVGYAPHPAGFQGPAPPPGTPAYAQNMSNPIQSQEDRRIDVPNREAHNVSPKSKREWLFVQEHPGPSPVPGSKARVSTDKVGGTGNPSSNIIDFSQKPREWIEGYQAGLQRQAISAHRMGKFLDGYCAGLLKSKAAGDASSTVAPSTSGSTKPASKRPSPALSSQTSSQLHFDGEIPVTSRPPLETRIESLDTLKQAIFAPQNEDAVLTPAADGPHISETSLNLGAWQKAQQGLANATLPVASQQSERGADRVISSRTSSIAPRQAILSGNSAEARSKEKILPPEPRIATGSIGAYLQPGHALGLADNKITQPSSPSLGTKSIPQGSFMSGSPLNPASRVTSITSLDASMYRQWPGNRIMTPTEWKSGSSIAHAASLATGYFANAQYDGTHDTPPAADLPGQIADATSPAGATQMQRVSSITSATAAADRHGRFREGSLDGVTNPASSPSAPMSPRMSPHNTPMKEIATKKDSSPGKGPSPTKAKFEQIAGKVGIRVTASPKNSENLRGVLEAGSPPDKRRWRDVWRQRKD